MGGVVALAVLLALMAYVYMRLSPYSRAVGAKRLAAIAGARDALLREARRAFGAAHEAAAGARACAALDLMATAASRRTIDCLSNATYYMTQRERIKMAVSGGARASHGAPRGRVYAFARACRRRRRSSSSSYCCLRYL